MKCWSLSTQLFFATEPELRAAYKIHGYMVHYGCENRALRDMLVEAYRKYDETYYGWWTHNSKYLLPYTACDDRHSFIRKPATKVQEIVDGAVEKWAEIHNEWRLLRLPKYLELDDPERIKFETSMQQVELERERQEYLRLKKKFDR